GDKETRERAETAAHRRKTGRGEPRSGIGRQKTAKSEKQCGENSRQEQITGASDLYRLASPARRVRTRVASLRAIPRSRDRRGDRRYGAGACDQNDPALRSSGSVQTQLPRCLVSDGLCSQGLDQRRVRRRRRWSPCAKVRAGCSRQRSIIRCSTIPTIANFSRSLCPQISQPSNWNDRIDTAHAEIGLVS